MHHQVGVGDARVDLADAVDGEDVAGRRPRELVGAVAGADGDRERVHAGRLHEPRRFLRVGEQLAVVEGALGPDPVLLPRDPGLERAEAAELALHRDPAGVGHLHDAAGDAHVVLVGGRRLAVLAERPVHHHRGEPELDRALADRGRSPVVLVHHHRDVRELFDRGQDQVAQEGRAGVLARAGRGLDDDGAVGLVRGLHDGAHLLEVVDVERRAAVTVLGRVVQKLAQ